LLEKQQWGFSTSSRGDRDQEEEDGFAFLTSACMVTSGEAALGNVKWYLDSGATDHMVKVANYFKKGRKLDKPLKINIAKNRVLVFATEIGNIEGKLKSETGYVELTEVLFVLDLKHNLMSVQKIERSGFDILFRAGTVFINKGMQNIAIGIRINGLYELTFKLRKFEATNCQCSALTLNKQTDLMTLA